MTLRKVKLIGIFYLKISGSKFIFLISFIDDILLASSYFDLLSETKQMLSRTFDMKDLGEATFVLGIEIHRDRSLHLLGCQRGHTLTGFLKDLIYTITNHMISLLPRVTSLVKINASRMSLTKIK